MGTAWHFPFFILASAVVYVATLWLVLRRRRDAFQPRTVAWVGAVTVVAGMIFAKYGENAGLSPAIYYGIPALVAWMLPPVAFRMRVRELAEYLPLTFLSAPLIHVVFSLFLGWNEYMPFLAVPSLAELIS